jgi:hypothetical protein
LIEADPNSSKEYLEQQATEESIETGDVVISCDQFFIKAGGKMSARVPFVVLPLTIFPPRE